MVAGGVVADRLVGPAFAREHRMLGFDGLVRAHRRRDLDELAEELSTEHAVVFQALIAALELGDALFPGALRRRRVEIEAREQIRPEMGHALSVSRILRQ